MADKNFGMIPSSFARDIAQMSRHGEYVDGEKYEQDREDAVDVLDELIVRARGLVGLPEWNDPLLSIPRDGKVTVTTGDLVDAMRGADAALNGDSNDAEHDALYALREALSEWLETR